jgi:hypothetical protein
LGDPDAQGRDANFATGGVTITISETVQIL